ncbi:Kinase, NEK [Giardia duodenalis]|uniref:non-specific serine/threonine protein kinase n=1 Tax=Giardia intestinalis (strain ATCC 50803 / WB clone C6) TaxID=184922 RepID=A8BX98_GIAIC|nr:Kinase, NEK [Giardia intestinalis]KAE8301728.1 Kinase, NEK [Giardia intestinalis]|eukprot:XP_001704318.1 Kinase, NEK [Giardia lamblia ATCC 50803]
MPNSSTNAAIDYAPEVFPALLASSYEQIQYLGTGTFGTVSTAIRKRDGVSVCIKEIDVHFCTDAKIGLLKKELEELAKLSAPNLIAINHYEYNPDIRAFYIETPRCESTLLSKLSDHRRAGTSFTEGEVWKVLYDICRGLLYLHSKVRTTELPSPNAARKRAPFNGYIHGDLKLENVGFCDGNAVLLDYGMNSFIDQLRDQQTILSTSAFLAPEAALGKDFNPKGDTWALGIIALALLRGRPEKVSVDNHLLAHLSFSGEKDFTDRLRSFIEQCLNINAPVRISSADALLFIEKTTEEIASSSPSLAESPTLISSINADMIDGIHEHLSELLTERDVCNHSALDLAIQKGNMEYIEILVKYLDTVGACLQLGPRPHIRRVSTYTNLMKIALLNKPAYIDEYLDAEANCVYGMHGMTALMIAASMGHAECVRKLIREAGVVSMKGWTALMYAVRENHVECVSLLRLEMGIMTKSSMRACDLADHLGHRDCAELLKREQLLCVGENCRVFSDDWYKELLGSAVFE